MRDHNHKKPVTRRDFLAQGLIASSGYIVLPSALEILLNTAIAEAQVCAPPASGGSPFPAFITIDATGGACFAWDIPPLDSGGQPLSSYSKLGLGTKPNTIQAPFANKIMRSGTAAAPTSGDGQGTLIPQIVTTLGANATTILGKTSVIPIWATSRDDNGTDPNGIQNAVIAAGLNGKIKLLGTDSSATGVANTDAFTTSIVPATPFVPNSIDDIVNSLGAPASGALGSLNPSRKNALMQMIKNINTSEATRLAAAQGGSTAAGLIGCAHDQNITTMANTAQVGDPRGDASVNTIWGITKATSTSDSNAVQAAMIYAALQGNSGPVGISMGGYDYHGKGQPTQDQRHQALGTLIGKILGSAQALNKDTFIYLLTDGATAADANSTTPSPPQGDSGGNGGNILFMFRASGAVPTITKPQIGYFNQSQQNDPNSPSENIQNAAVSAFLHYLAFAGSAAGVTSMGTLLSQFKTLSPKNGISDAVLQQLIAIGLS